jgi:hypothetical protein
LGNSRSSSRTRFGYGGRCTKEPLCSLRAATTGCSTSDFVDRITFKNRVVENKANVYEVIRVLETDGFLGVVGILDADFDLVEGRPAKSGNLVIGDSHDLESMLVRSPALDGILIEFGSADKIERFGRDIRTTMPQAAYPVACLRLYSERSGGMLRFDGLAYRRFLDRRTLNVDYTALVTEVKNCSQRLDIPASHLVEQIELIEQEGHDPFYNRFAAVKPSF